MESIKQTSATSACASPTWLSRVPKPIGTSSIKLSYSPNPTRWRILPEASDLIFLPLPPHMWSGSSYIISKGEGKCEGSWFVCLYDCTTVTSTLAGIWKLVCPDIICTISGALAIEKFLIFGQYKCHYTSIQTFFQYPIWTSKAQIPIL